MARKQGKGNGVPPPPPPNGGAPPPPPPIPPFQPAHYIFRLDEFSISNTRSVDEDTDHVTFGLKVGNTMFEPQVKHMGDVDNGDHAVGLAFGPVLIDDPNTSVAVNYQIINNGHASDADIEQKLAAGAVALLGKVFSLATPWTAVLGVVVNFIFGLIFADCDGPVAVDQFNLTGGDLWGFTQGTSTHFWSRFYPGVDSPVGCGSNSEYWVVWSVVGA